MPNAARCLPGGLLVCIALWATVNFFGVRLTTATDFVNGGAVQPGQLAAAAARDDSRTQLRARGGEQAWQDIEGCQTKYVVLQEGEGDKQVSKASAVTVHAKGVVRQTGEKFWSTKDPGQQPFSYVAGVGGVIRGWDMGCLGMKVGEQRMLVIPAEEGYGPKGFPAWGIPPGAVLEFTLECLKIE
eukprot:TRINITY_DN7187_c1_g1_i1.p2 TRINITY_DN7187_c1_g1~~TRINITY_DN7187_c1_g1_i1.p2  ORF type:complete len:185 (+),score=45.34 TRINITY_DN7187_c1_g1_i1:65-619(+)